MTHDANIVLDLVSLLTVLLVLRGKPNQSQLKENCPPHFHALLIIISLILSFDMVGWLLDGAPYASLRVPAFVVNTVYYILQMMYSWLWLFFVWEWTGKPRRKLCRWRKLLSALPMAAEFVALLMNPYTGWVFCIDAGNVYRRGPGHLLNLIPFVVYLCAALLRIIHASVAAETPEERRHNLVLCLYMFLPLCGGVIEVLHYGTPWIWPLTTLSLLLVYMNILDHQAENDRLNAARLEVELAESRRTIMLSQMQPHFLYNALCVIQDLCHDKAPEAEKATLSFSRFLRGNMDALTTTGSIPFEQELAHTQYYLDLEQKRFEQRLHVVFDIQCTTFRLPPLTLQPIVENAVRNGVCKREKGGTVTISTGETKDAYIICVKDDGVGFDPSHPRPNGRSGIGIQNVKERLSCQMGGSLRIESEPNIGTTALITLPKGGTPQ